MNALLATGIRAGYGRTEVLRNVDIVVRPGSVTALLGPNGAGKTTLLRVLAGVLRPGAGSVRIAGKEFVRASPHARSRAGLCLIPEGRGIFRALTVRENIRLNSPPWLSENDSVDRTLAVFPALTDRLGQVAGRLSGGQQQMVALSRAFLSEPTIVLLDEVSMGLAPLVVDEIFQAITTLAQTGAALLIVEQYVARVLAVADSAYLMNRGEILFAGTPAELSADEVLEGYLGSGAGATAR